VSQVQQPQQPQTPPKEEPRVRLMVVDDHKIMRLGLRGMLETQPDFVVVGEAGNGVEALQTAKVEQPDVIVMDINMPKMNGVEATKRIKAELPKIQVVGLSVHEDGAMEQAMREAGASAYHRKGGAPEEIYQTIRTLVRR
jgi:DNA-binding NarL/FixJ family response regulator